ncbi:MAG TPA: hypothetical protein VHY31_21050, partial [Streptosporangiaceae bacterium]|nr:hypothetical protein [Streptosporangiaceae bacterium]
AVPAWPIITNTQGGPVHDADQRILDPYGDPVGDGRLYEAGELGAIWATSTCCQATSSSASSAAASPAAPPPPPIPGASAS